MTAQAAKVGPVAHGASGFVEVEVACAMCAHEALYVIGRLEVITLGMTLLAAERVVDLAMADQAVRHPRKISSGERGRILHPAMTGGAGVGGI